jgi:hypothetical protein
MDRTETTLPPILRYRRNVFAELYLATRGRIQFTETLPSNDRRDTRTDTQTEGRDL